MYIHTGQCSEVAFKKCHYVTSFKVLFRPQASPIQHSVKHNLEKLHSQNQEFALILKRERTQILDPTQYGRLSRGRLASPCESKCHHISFVTDPLGASDYDPGLSRPLEEEHKCNLRGPPTSVLKTEMLSRPLSPAPPSKSFDGKQSRPWRSRVATIGGSKPPQVPTPSNLPPALPPPPEPGAAE